MTSIWPHENGEQNFHQREKHALCWNDLGIFRELNESQCADIYKLLEGCQCDLRGKFNIMQGLEGHIKKFEFHLNIMRAALAGLANWIEHQPGD